jgi:FtsZ-interacting cell division protein ZipA
MDQNRMMVVIALVVIAVIAVAVIAFFASRKRRSQQLRARFGPEYDRVVRQEGDPRKAEGVLEFRQKRREKFNIRTLSAADRSSFATRWNEVQSRFVDDPRGAVTVADSLVTDVMQLRGYPIGEFDQRAADLSVDYPLIVDNYRAAHDIALRHSAGKASTEDLRQAMVHYRALFQELLEESSNMERKIERKGA